MINFINDQVTATIVEKPFFDPERKRALPDPESGR